MTTAHDEDPQRAREGEETGDGAAERLKEFESERGFGPDEPLDLPDEEVNEEPLEDESDAMPADDTAEPSDGSDG